MSLDGSHRGLGLLTALIDRHDGPNNPDPHTIV